LANRQKFLFNGKRIIQYTLYSTLYSTPSTAHPPQYTLLMRNMGCVSSRSARCTFTQYGTSELVLARTHQFCIGYGYATSTFSGSSG
jgi:hypothetical protein